jgi:hypothetical protein
MGLPFYGVMAGESLAGDQNLFSIMPFETVVNLAE